MELINWNEKCQHAVNKKFQCNEIPKNVLLVCKKNIFKDNDRIHQNSRLVHLLKISAPVRRRKRSRVDISKPHDFQIKYKVKNNP